MTRNDYLKELGARLSRLPKNERDDAFAFYSEYFEDAENDEVAIESLGSPSRLAAQINAEYSARMLEESEQARKNPLPEPPKNNDSQGLKSDLATLPAPSQKYTQDAYNQQTAPSANGGSSPYAKKSDLSWIWAVILGIFALPVALPIIISAIAVVIVVISVAFALIVSLVAVVLALIVGGLGALFGIGTAVSGVGGGLVAAGAAIAALGLALILIPLLIKLCIWTVRGTGKLVTGIFNRLKRRSGTDAQE